MKKIFLAAILLFGASSLCHAYPDSFDNERPAVWRSSTNCGAHSWGLLSTGAIIIHAVAVGSPTVNISPSHIAIFNSTHTPIGGNAANFLTTGTLTSTNMLSAVSGVMNFPTNEYNVYFSSGVVVNKVGGSCSTILWDYRDSGLVNKPFYKLNYPWKP